MSLGTDSFHAATRPELNWVYGYPSYWVPQWANGLLPLVSFPNVSDGIELAERRLERQPRYDGHLRSAREISGYSCNTLDGGIGHVGDVLLDATWCSCLLFTPYQRCDEWSFNDHGRPIGVRVHGRIRTDNQEALMDAVLAGAGLAMLPTWLVKRQLESRHLQCVLTGFEGPRTPVYAVYPRAGIPPNKVRAFVGFLAEHYRKEGILLQDDIAPAQHAGSLNAITCGQLSQAGLKPAPGAIPHTFRNTVLQIPKSPDVLAEPTVP